MNNTSRIPIPLRPDRSLTLENSFRSFCRACLLSARQTRDRNIRSDDREVELILRSPVSPHSTANTATLATVAHAFVAALRPVSAAAEVIARSLQLDFGGSYQLTAPSVSIAQAEWVGEDGYISVASGASVPGPTISPHKLAMITAMTNEMVNHTNAEAIMRQLLLESCGPALDIAMFSATAGSATQPAGILAGITPLTASTVGGAPGLATDLGLIAEALAPSAGGSTPIFIAAPAHVLDVPAGQYCAPLADASDMGSTLAQRRCSSDWGQVVKEPPCRSPTKIAPGSCNNLGKYLRGRCTSTITLSHHSRTH
jgi:Phage capsid family